MCLFYYMDIVLKDFQIKLFESRICCTLISYFRNPQFLNATFFSNFQYLLFLFSKKIINLILKNELYLYQRFFLEKKEDYNLKKQKFLIEWITEIINKIEMKKLFEPNFFIQNPTFSWYFIYKYDEVEWCFLIDLIDKKVEKHSILNIYIYFGRKLQLSMHCIRFYLLVSVNIWV